jgi:L-alanine-DL-glutamate epimerase-like enolase superfamily enzyme
MRALRTIAPEVTFRVDANGAFSQPESGWTPLKKLEALAAIGLHSIEQPLHPSDKRGLAELCKVSPVPIALDESLIGVPVEAQGALLDAIDPDFLVLKPSLLGGFAASQHWIQQAEERDMGWWVTSALETNMGLNAIAQWTANGIQSDVPLLPQGLGTGGLFTNNIPAPLEVSEGYLSTRGDLNWEAPVVRSVS